MTSANILPLHDQRLLILGASGTGKTTLAKELLKATDERVLAIDPKGTLGGKDGLPDYTIVRDPTRLKYVRTGKILYRPGGMYTNPKYYDDVYKWAYDTQELLVYTDEVFATMRGCNAPDWQRACITAGRELGIGMISSSQRPRGIDQRLLSESERLACFALRHPDDCKYVSYYMGLTILAPLPQFAFYYWEEGQEVIKMRIRLTEAKGPNG